MPAIDDGKVAELVERLSITDAPLVRWNISEALSFFQAHMPTLEDETAFGFLRGMDLHSPVRRVMLSPPVNLAAYRRPDESAYKLFYTKMGTSKRNLGVVPQGRQFCRYELVQPAPALQSRTTAVLDDWSYPALPPSPADGGDTQFIVPNAQRVMKVVQDKRAPTGRAGR